VETLATEIVYEPITAAASSEAELGEQRLELYVEIVDAD